jgi:uncharacterized membrane protein YdjX (TVP38/TMEM64 family)
VIVAAAVAGLVFLLTSDSLKAPLERAVQWGERVMKADPVLGAIVFFFLSMLSATLTFTSSIVLVPPANLVWGRTITFLLLWAGWIAGATLAYVIGRLARPLVMRMGYREKLEEYQDFAQRKMTFWVVLLICTAAQSEISGYFFGGLHYSYWKYIGAMVIVEAMYALVVVTAGQSLLHSNPYSLLAVLAGLALVIFVATAVVRRLKRKRAFGGSTDD